MDRMTIIAAADGSSLGNPGPTGWAWYVDRGCWAAGGAASGTNNIGELTAVAELLEATAAAGEPLRILCDSQYVINSVTKWMPGWKRRGWRKADGKPVQNRELLERIDAGLAGREVDFEWVRGHAGHELNEAADERARAAAAACAAGSVPESGPGFPAAAGAAAGGDAGHGSEVGGGGSGRGAEAGGDGAGRGDAAGGKAGRGRAAGGEAGGGPADELDLWGDEGEPGEDGAWIVTPLERELLTDGARRDPARVDALLHEAFEEIGSAGVRYDRAAILRLIAPLSADARAHGFREEAIASGVRLVRYRLAAGDRESERASLWCFEPASGNEGAWRMRFHQSTIIMPDGER